jgi:hypothetical protein
LFPPFTKGVPEQAAEAIICMPAFKELSMSGRQLDTSRSSSIDHSSSAPPVTIPRGHVGEFVIPGTGRRVWWTGRVAIGLLHEPQSNFEGPAQSALWIQKLLLGKPGRIGIAQA